MELKILDNIYRTQINDYIKREWSGPLIVSKGNSYDSSELPGFTVSENGELYGAVIYRMCDGECEISALFSLVESIGVGTKLINAVVEKAKNMNCKRVWLTTTNDNINAIRFYQKRGWLLKEVHINGFERTKRLKNLGETVYGNAGIPILHEFEYPIILNISERTI